MRPPFARPSSLGEPFPGGCKERHPFSSTHRNARTTSAALACCCSLLASEPLHRRRAKLACRSIAPKGNKPVDFVRNIFLAFKGAARHIIAAEDAHVRTGRPPPPCHTLHFFFFFSAGAVCGTRGD